MYTKVSFVLLRCRGLSVHLQWVIPLPELWIAAHIQTCLVLCSLRLVETQPIRGDDGKCHLDLTRNLLKSIRMQTIKLKTNVLKLNWFCSCCASGYSDLLSCQCYCKAANSLDAPSMVLNAKCFDTSLVPRSTVDRSNKYSPTNWFYVDWKYRTYSTSPVLQSQQQQLRACLMVIPLQVRSRVID